MYTVHCTWVLEPQSPLRPVYFFSTNQRKWSNYTISAYVRSTCTHTPSSAAPVNNSNNIQPLSNSCFAPKSGCRCESTRWESLTWFLAGEKARIFTCSTCQSIFIFDTSPIQDQERRAGYSAVNSSAALPSPAADGAGAEEGGYDDGNEKNVDNDKGRLWF